MCRMPLQAILVAFHGRLGTLAEQQDGFAAALTQAVNGLEERLGRLPSLAPQQIDIDPVMVCPASGLAWQNACCEPSVRLHQRCRCFALVSLLACKPTVCQLKRRMTMEYILASIVAANVRTLK